MYKYFLYYYSMCKVLTSNLLYFSRNKKDKNSDKSIRILSFLLLSTYKEYEDEIRCNTIKNTCIIFFPKFLEKYFR